MTKTAKSKRKRKYLGMTSTEIAIIAIFGVLILCVSLGVGFVILQAMPSPLTPIPVAVIQATYTRLATYTPLPTSTPSPIPTNTPEPTYTSEPTSTPTPTDTPLPTSTETPEPPTATPTTDPEVKALIKYLKTFAPIANKVWSTFPGKSDVNPRVYYDSIYPDLYKQLEGMTVPERAKTMHSAFKLVALDVAQYHHSHEGALLWPAQYNEYMTAAEMYGKDALAWYYQEYLPARDSLLSDLGLSAKQVGFTE